MIEMEQWINPIIRQELKVNIQNLIKYKTSYKTQIAQNLCQHN